MLLQNVSYILWKIELEIKFTLKWKKIKNEGVSLARSYFL